MEKSYEIVEPEKSVKYDIGKFILSSGLGLVMKVFCLLVRFSTVLTVLAISVSASGQDDSILPPLEEVVLGQSHISSSNSGVNPFSGVNINQLVGAERFYNAGFDGASAILGNVEAGHVFDGHSALGHVATQVTGTGASGADAAHATWVTHAMSGTFAVDNYSSAYFSAGIAKGAQTWSGAIATSFGGSGSFSTSSASTASVYSTMLKTGVAGQTVDVINSSWGFTEPTGWNLTTVGVDGYVNDTGKILVVSAGNDGPGPNTVGGIGAGYNSITVGSLGSDTSNPVYDTISSFSSRGPNDFRDLANNQVVTGVRAAVDIVAPGQNMTLAAINTTNSYNINLQGTSFSAPTVAGGAGLMVDAAKNVFAGNTNAIDGRVIKSVMLNSAAKNTGWNNGQSLIGGIIQTTQSLDWATGAGKLDLDTTYDNFISIASGGLAGTTDLAGTTQGDLGNVDGIGWDFGFVGNNVGVDDSNFYFIDQQLVGGSDLSVTLSWFADHISGADADFAGAGANHLANLDLRVFEFDNLTDRNIIRTVAESISVHNVVEHLFFELDNTGFYGVQVDYTAAHWDFGVAESGEFYGLSWSGVVTAVPEPGAAIALPAIAMIAMLRRRRV